MRILNLIHHSGTALSLPFFWCNEAAACLLLLLLIPTTVKDEQDPSVPPSLSRPVQHYAAAAFSWALEPLPRPQKHICTCTSRAGSVAIWKQVLGRCMHSTGPPVANNWVGLGWYTHCLAFAFCDEREALRTTVRWVWMGKPLTAQQCRNHNLIDDSAQTISEDQMAGWPSNFTCWAPLFYQLISNSVNITLIKSTQKNNPYKNRRWWSRSGTASKICFFAIIMEAHMKLLSRTQLRKNFIYLFIEASNSILFIYFEARNSTHGLCVRRKRKPPSLCPVGISRWM